ncbi:MAG: hypothetical protein O2820_19395 [Planctomycetota bacterium]|nr:hypothetical protein [Planctomycetota bacterium]MDA1251381.1 hypothetical protein [Planctomycetota bacterium]
MLTASKKLLTAPLAAALSAAVFVSQALACPSCSFPSLTLAESLAQTDAAVLVQWASGTKPTEESAGNTVYEVKQIMRNHKDKLKIGDQITLPRYRASQVGDLFVLMGSSGTTLEWGSPLEVTETAFNYISQAPSPEVPTSKRLEYYARFLEYSDAMIANDAYGEFANSPYKDVALAAQKLPREKVRKWIESPDTPGTRLGLYGLLIGVCGNADDAELVKQKITEKSDDFRLGIDGLMSGYLVLTGDKGLAVIDEAKLKNTDVPFSETYAAMQALRFMWRYGEGRIEKERLRQSMRILLDRPELADLVIADLARWQDWSIQSRLMKMYGEGEYNIPSIKRAIVRYMLVCSKDVPEDAAAGETSKLPEHVVSARQHVAALRKMDEKTVAEAERFFFLK